MGWWSESCRTQAGPTREERIPAQDTWGWWGVHSRPTSRAAWGAAARLCCRGLLV